jgi:hypothetical protein
VAEFSILIGVDCEGADYVVFGRDIVGADNENDRVVVGSVAGFTGIESMVDLSRLSVTAAVGSLAYQLAFSGHQVVEVGCYM